MQHVSSTVRFLFLTGLLLSAAVPRASAQGACDRACLTGFLDGWFKGLVNNTASGVPVAKDVKITKGRLPVLITDYGQSVPIPH